MKRRTLLRGVCVGVLPASVGCLGLDGAAGNETELAVGVTLINLDDEPHVVDVAVADEDDVVFEDRYDVPADDSVGDASVLPAGSYEVSVTVDGGASTRSGWKMDGCAADSILVTLGSSGDVRVTNACHDD